MVNDVKQDIQLEAGEYKIYTDVKLESPEIGLSVYGNHGFNNSNFQVYPNPTSSSTTIKFELNEPADVSIVIYDMYGKVLKTIYSGNLHTGLQEFIWNGNSENSSKVVNGMYFCQVSINGSREVIKLMMNK